MTVPASPTELIYYLALLVPGVVFAGARVALRGSRASDRSVASRVLEAIVASAIFDSLYAIVLHQPLAAALPNVRGYIAGHTFPVVVGFLVGAVLIPYSVAWGIHGKVPLLARPSRVWRRRIRPRLTRSRSGTNPPTAWDYAHTVIAAGWVRVRIDENVWVGGKLGRRSRASSYPEARDLFIATQWNVGPAGEFESEVAESQGIWLAIKDDYVVEWLMDRGQRSGASVSTIEG